MEVLLKEPLKGSREVPAGGSPVDLAKFCAQVLDKAKMEDITILDVKNALQIADCFVLASARNARHIKAASSELLKGLREKGISRRGVEGHRDAKWLLVDLTDVIVHFFLPETRQYYDLESLWGDCPRISWEEPAAVALDG
jgi:ribosome-associated protein